jgi:cyanate permease
MNGYDFFVALRSAGTVIGIAVGGIVLFASFIWMEVASLINYRHRFGAEWQAKYEEYVGPLSSTYTRIALSAFGIIAILALAVWLFRLLRNKSGAAGTERKSRRHRDISPIERKVRYKRNALLGVYFGLAGVLASIALTVIDWGLFRDHDDEVSLAIFVFMGGYAGVITGCGYWLKAKRWNEALVSIAFLPLVILFIPFVRLIFVASPMILPILMVMMPLLLVAVVFALPDQSTSAQRRSSRSRMEPNQKR